jgi:thiosulfate/3-mercaptopyruvate sulfurtransferase
MPTDRPLRLFDTTVHLRPAVPGPFTVESGRADYDAGHIPGAAFIDLPSQLSDTASPLRFMLPPWQALERAFAAAGISDGDDVVLYSSTAPMWATRIWWMLKSMGFEARVLDGGLPRWKAEGRPLTTPPTVYPAGRLRAQPRPAMWADRHEVQRAIGDGAVCTLNGLGADMHRGDAPVHYGRRGHIAGSVNVPWSALLDAQGCFKPIEALRSEFDAVGALAAPRVICYCGGGIAATMDALALDLLGHADVAVYDGSLSEWVLDPALPMATGG